MEFILDLVDVFLIFVIVSSLISLTALIYYKVGDADGWDRYKFALQEQVARTNADINKLNNLLNDTYVTPIAVSL